MGREGTNMSNPSAALQVPGDDDLTNLVDPFPETDLTDITYSPDIDNDDFLKAVFGELTGVSGPVKM